MICQNGTDKVIVLWQNELGNKFKVKAGKSLK